MWAQLGSQQASGTLSYTYITNTSCTFWYDITYAVGITLSTFIYFCPYSVLKKDFLLMFRLTSDEIKQSTQHKKGHFQVKYLIRTDMNRYIEDFKKNILLKNIPKHGLTKSIGCQTKLCSQACKGSDAGHSWVVSGGQKLRRPEGHLWRTKYRRIKFYVFLDECLRCTTKKYIGGR